MSDPSSPRPVPAIRATAHVMLLEPGVFCVFPAPGSPAPDPASGLPGVRLSAAPGAAGYAGQVALAGFRGDGWLGGAGDAALLRVSGGAAPVLVTTYQAEGAAGDAPKLQVLRLSEAAAPAPAAPSVPATPMEAMAHVYGIGDVGGRIGDWIGERGSRRWIEGFALHSQRLTEPDGLDYQALLGRGWLSPWAEGGQFCGSRGMSLPILGLQVRLRAAAAAAFTVSVSATFVDGSAVGPVTDGVCAAESLAALEAFQVVLQPKEKAAARRRR